MPIHAPFLFFFVDVMGTNTNETPSQKTYVPTRKDVVSSKSVCRCNMRAWRNDQKDKESNLTMANWVFAQIIRIKFCATLRG